MPSIVSAREVGTSPRPRGKSLWVRLVLGMALCAGSSALPLVGPALSVPACAQTTPPAPEAQAADRDSEPAKPGTADSTAQQADAEASSDATETDPAADLRRPPPKRVIELGLDQAVQIGLRNNLDIRVEELTSYQSFKDIEVAAAIFDPLFTTTYSMVKSRSPTVDTLAGLGATTTILVNPAVNQNASFGISGLLSPGTTYSLTASDNRRDTPDSGFFGFNPRNSPELTLTVTQPLLRDFGYDVNLADLRIAEETAGIAVEALQDRMEETVAAIIDAYWNVLLAQNVIEVRTQGLREAQELLAINENKLAVGNATEIDVKSARAEIARQRSDFIAAQNDLEEARDLLLDLINYREVLRERDELRGSLAPYEQLGIELTSDVTVTPMSVELDSSIRIALEERADIRQERRRVRAAELDLDRQKRQLLPRFDVDGSWTFEGLEENLGNSVDELFSGRYYTWQLGVTFEYPFGNRQARANALRAEAEVEASLLRLRRIEDQATIDVARAVRDLESRYQTVLTRREEAQLREEQLQGERERLAAGTSTSYEVLQISNDLLEARLEEARAEIDFQNSVTAYKRALGVLRQEHRPASPPR